MAYENQNKCTGCGISIPDITETVVDVSTLLCDKCNKLQEVEEQKAANLWSEFSDYPHADWKHEVANDDTLNGYWDWVIAQIDGGE